MGNKLGRKRQVVDEKYTKPQGLYPIKDVDYKKLRKLILESKLAPCYPGDDDECNTMEECPICFLHYPTLNRSRCCLKSICTECFLQMKDPHSSRPTQCPFCKASNYAVEYRGGKSKEEQGLEQIEEQKVIEAKIRMRQQELLEEEERMLKRQETSSYSGVTQTENFDATTSRVVEGEASVSSQDTSTTPTILGLQQLRRHHRDDDVDVDLEDIMLMEAIWLSIQENGGKPIDHALLTRNVPEQYSTPPPLQYSDPSQLPPLASSSTSSSISPSGGLAYSIASLAEQQQSSHDPSSSSSNSYCNYRDMSSLHNSSPSRSSNRRIKACYRRKKSKQSCHPAAQRRNLEEYLRKTMMDTQSNQCGADWGGVNRSEIVEVGGTSYGDGWSSSYHHPTPSGAHMLQQLPSYTQQHDVIDERFSSSSPSSDESDSPQSLLGRSQPPPPLQMQEHYAAGVGSCVGEGSYESNMACPVIPETFEEQMMLAMAVSLAEARAVTASQGVVAAWH